MNASSEKSGGQRLVTLCMILPVAAILILGARLSSSTLDSETHSTNRSIRWIASEPIPTELARHILLVDNSHHQLYTIGGATLSGARPTPVGSVYTAAIKPDGRLSPWVSSSPALPITLFNAAGIIIGNQVVVLGGFGGPFYSYLDTVVLGEVDPLSGRLIGWYTSTHSLPKRIAAHTAVEYNSSIYVIGGLNVNCPISDVYVASLRELGGSNYPWASASSLPIAVHSHATVISGNVVYVIGGCQDSKCASVLDSVYYGRIGPHKGLINWSSTTSLPAPMRSAAATVSGDYLYIIGGYQKGMGPSSTVYRASIRTDGTLTSWVSLSQELLLLPPLFRHAAATNQLGQIYVVGGETDLNTGSVHLNHVYFTPLFDFEKLVVPRGPVTYGDIVSYTLKLTNLGVRDLKDLIITDTVQANVPMVFEFRNLPVECQVYPYVTDTITCAIPSLGLGATERLDFQVATSQPATTLLSDLNSLPVQYGEGNAEIGVVSANFLRARGNNAALEVDDTPLCPDVADGLPGSPGTGTVISLKHDLLHYSPNCRFLHATEVVSLSNSRQMEPSHICSGLAPDCGADLSLEKSGDPLSVVAGQTLSYTLLVNNAGPMLAQDVAVVDCLPDGATFVTATLPLSSTTPISWSLGSIPAEGNQEIHLVVQVASGISGTITNTAVVNSDTWDPNSDNNIGEEDTVVVGQADLRIEKSGIPDPVSPGEVLTYTLSITNWGPSDAGDVIVTDTLSAGVCDLDAVPPNCSRDPLVCALGTVPAGDSDQIQIKVTVCPTSTGVLTNTAIATSSTRDINLANNEAEELTGVSERADLRIQIGGNLERVVPGDELIYALRVSNYGPSGAQNVAVSDTLPIGVDFRSSVPPLVSGPDPLTWCTGTLAATEIWTIEVRTAVGSKANGVLINAASVTSKVDDPDLSNNRSEQETLAPVVVTNKAYICEDRLWCKESNVVINSPFNVYLPIILKAAGG